jgi:hypothetical protein
MGRSEISLSVPPLKEQKHEIFSKSLKEFHKVKELFEFSSHWTASFRLVSLQLLSALHLHRAVHDPVGC